MRIFEYIVYRVFTHFETKNPELSKSRTINFMSLFECSLIIPLFAIFNGITNAFSSPENPNPSMKYYIGIPSAILLITTNSILLKKKLSIEGIKELNTKYSKKEKHIPMWLIFSLPIIFVFVVPIIYGAINGTLRFPLFE